MYVGVWSTYLPTEIGSYTYILELYNDIQYFHGTPATHQYGNDKKMTIVNRYSRSVNMNSFAPFSLVGEPVTLPEYKDRRFLIQGAHERSATPGPFLPRRPPSVHVRTAKPPAHTYRENGYFHEATGTSTNSWNITRPVASFNVRFYVHTVTSISDKVYNYNRRL